MRFGRIFHLPLFIFYFAPHILVLVHSQDGEMWFEGGDKNITVVEGETAKLVWRFSGCDSDLRDIKWATYLKSGSSRSLDFIWSVNADGSQNRRFRHEKPAYQGRVSATKDADSATLIISNVKRQDENKYRCLLNLSLSKDVFSPSITLIVVAPPGPPVITSSSVDKSFIVLRWNPPQSVGKSSIWKYIIYVKDVGINASKYIKHETTSTSYTISGLKMKTSYTVSVAACNKVGTGKRSTERVLRTLYEGVPLAPRILNNERVQKSNKLLLKWSEPDNGGYPILKYSIQYKKKGETTLYIEELPGNNTLEYELRLDWGTNFWIGVRAWNVEGPSLLENSSLFVIGVPEQPVRERLKSEADCSCKTCTIISSVMSVVLVILLVLIAVLFCSVCALCLRTRERHFVTEASHKSSTRETIELDVDNGDETNKNRHTYVEVLPRKYKESYQHPGQW